VLIADKQADVVQFAAAANALTVAGLVIDMNHHTLECFHQRRTMALRPMPEGCAWHTTVYLLKSGGR
jgi:hypothetical protein